MNAWGSGRGELFASAAGRSDGRSAKGPQQGARSIVALGRLPSSAPSSVLPSSALPSSALSSSVPCPQQQLDARTAPFISHRCHSPCPKGATTAITSKNTDSRDTASAPYRLGSPAASVEERNPRLGKPRRAGAVPQHPTG